MTQAIIDKKTRVILRLTEDIDFPISDLTEKVTVPSNTSLGNEYKKIDSNGVISKATKEEIYDSNVDDKIVAQKRMAIQEQLDTVLKDITDNGASLDNLTQYFRIITTRI